MGTAADRPAIYRIRHQVYATELHQHDEDATGMLSDPLDEYNEYIVATREGEVVGFSSVTPPGRRYSIDKYFRREDLPFPIDGGVYEIRLLTIRPDQRGGRLTLALLYTAVRYCEEQGATRYVGTGHGHVTEFYRSTGMHAPGLSAPSGPMTFDLVTATRDGILARGGRHRRLAMQLFDGSAYDWQLDFERI